MASRVQPDKDNVRFSITHMHFINIIPHYLATSPEDLNYAKFKRATYWACQLVKSLASPPKAWWVLILLRDLLVIVRTSVRAYMASGQIPHVAIGQALVSNRSKIPHLSPT